VKSNWQSMSGEPTKITSGLHGGIMVSHTGSMLPTFLTLANRSPPSCKSPLCHHVGRHPTLGQLPKQHQPRMNTRCAVYLPQILTPDCLLMLSLARSQSCKCRFALCQLLKSQQVYRNFDWQSRSPRKGLGGLRHRIPCSTSLSSH